MSDNNNNNREVKKASSSGTSKISTNDPSSFGNFASSDSTPFTPVTAPSKRGSSATVDSHSVAVNTPSLGSGSVWGPLPTPTNMKSSQKPAEASATKPSLSTMMKNGRSVLSPPSPVPVSAPVSSLVKGPTVSIAASASLTHTKKVSTVSSTGSGSGCINVSEEEKDSVPRPSFSLESFMRKPATASKNNSAINATKPVEPITVAAKANPWSKIPTTSSSTLPSSSSTSTSSSTNNQTIGKRTSSASAPSAPFISASTTNFGHGEGINSDSTKNKTTPKSLLEIQAEEERKHQNLFVHGNCVLDKYESAWSVGITRGTAASMRDLMTQQEEALRKEEQIRKDALIAKQIKKQEQDLMNQSKCAKKNKKNSNNYDSKNQSTAITATMSTTLNKKS